MVLDTKPMSDGRVQHHYLFSYQIKLSLLIINILFVKSFPLLGLIPPDLTLLSLFLLSDKQGYI